MKIIVLGGAGDMGSTTVRDLAEDEAGLRQIALHAALAQVGVQSLEDALFLLAYQRAQGEQLLTPPLQIVCSQREMVGAQIAQHSAVLLRCHLIPHQPI